MGSTAPAQMMWCPLQRDWCSRQLWDDPFSEHGGKHGHPCYTQHLLVVAQKKERLGALLLETVLGGEESGAQAS